MPPLHMCTRPGTKKLGNETPLETVKRYISEKIPQLEELVEFDESGMRREFDTQQSSNLNLQTTYVRTICKGELRGTFDAPCRKASSQPHFGDSGGEPAETAPRRSVHRMSVRTCGFSVLRWFTDGGTNRMQTLTVLCFFFSGMCVCVCLRCLPSSQKRRQAQHAGPCSVTRPTGPRGPDQGPQQAQQGPASHAQRHRNTRAHGFAKMQG